MMLLERESVERDEEIAHNDMCYMVIIEIEKGHAVP